MVFHKKLKGYFARKQQERKQTRAATALIKKKSRAAAFKERESQAIRFVGEREKFKTEQRIKRMRSGGFLGQLDRLTRPPKSVRAVPRTVSKRRKKRKTVKHKKPGTTRKPPRDIFDFRF